MRKRSRLPTPIIEDVQSYDELVRILNEIEVTLFEEETDLKKGVKAINDLLATIEHLLLRVFFVGYQDWLSKPEDERKDIPASLVSMGEKVHKLILSRGKFVLEMLKEKLEGAEEKKKLETGYDLLKTPPELLSYFDEMEDDGNEEKEKEKPSE